MRKARLDLLAALEREGEAPTVAVRGRSAGEVTELLRGIEDEVRAGPTRCLEVGDGGAVTLRTRAGTWDSGRFRTPTLGELRRECAAAGGGDAGEGARLSVLLGNSPLSDIGTLQALLGDGVLFQAASQFNCLEARSPGLAPISSYPGDPTQGPRASVSAFPGTFQRHYLAPGEGARFVQDETRQLDLLAAAVPPEVARVQGGYLLLQNVRDPEALAEVLTEGFEAIRVGVHGDVEVALGHAWGGPVPAPAPRIHQVFTSTLALGGYSRGRVDEPMKRSCRQLLRAAYLGTLLAAGALRARGVVLTLIGGGVFGNSHTTIWEAILWALDRVSESGGAPEVWVNARDFDVTRSRVLEDVAVRGGVVAEVGSGGVVVLG